MQDGGGVTHVLVGTKRLTSQRFHFARLLGMASQHPNTEQILPITASATATQKFGRAFAQEFLCPWTELDGITAERGTGETVRAHTAERYGVSEMLVATTLVNRGRLDRTCLATFGS